MIIMMGVMVGCDDGVEGDDGCWWVVMMMMLGVMMVLRVMMDVGGV